MFFLPCAYRPQFLSCFLIIETLIVFVHIRHADLWWILFMFLIQFRCLDTGKNGFSLWLQGELKVSFESVLWIFLAWNVLWIDERPCRLSLVFVLRDSHYRNSGLEIFFLNPDSWMYLWKEASDKVISFHGIHVNNVSKKGPRF